MKKWHKTSPAQHGMDCEQLLLLSFEEKTDFDGEWVGTGPLLVAGRTNKRR